MLEKIIKLMLCAFLCCSLKSMADCNQLYVSSVKLTRGSKVDCYKLWNFYKSYGDNFMLSLMILNGLGEQNINPYKALEYANKVKLEDGDAPAELDGLKLAIEQRIKDPSLNHIPVAYCSLATSGNSMGICESVNFEEKNKKLEVDVSKIPTKNRLQRNALNHLLIKFQQFNTDDFQSQKSDGMFQGTGRSAWGFQAQEAQISFFWKILHQFIESPNEFIQGYSKKSTYQSKLNLTYQKLLELQKKTSSSDLSAKAFRKSQESWLEYQKAFLSFGEIYYKENYSELEIQRAIKIALNVKRLKDIREQLDGLTENVKFNSWY